MSDQLDAILTSTGEATHTILESLEAISAMTGELREAPDGERTLALCDRIAESATKGMEVCGFQDITGQRVAKIVRSLQFIEERVDAMIEIWGREPIESLGERPPEDDADVKDGITLAGPALPGKEISQEEIDKLFA